MFYFVQQFDSKDVFLKFFYCEIFANFARARPTWYDFLQFAAFITNLFDAIYYFDVPNIEINEKHRIVAQAALRYEDFFKDLKYSEFIEDVRIS